jgi:hypothetical protein
MPGVLEAISSVACSVSKTLHVVASHLAKVQFYRSVGMGGALVPPHPRDQLVQREVLVLSARLSDAVLQLALQQLRQHQQQQAGGSRAVMQLVQSAEHLLRSAAETGLADVRERTVTATLPLTDEGSAPCNLRDIQLRVRRAMCDDSQQWVETLHTGLLRLKALQQAAAQHPYAASQHQQAATEGSEGAPVQSPSAAANVAAASVEATPAASGSSATSPDAAVGSNMQAAAYSGAQPWCPIHSSSPAPLVLEVEEGTLQQRLSEVYCSITPQPRLPLMRCGNKECSSTVGDSEAGLMANRRKVLCSGCGVVRYCSPTCARLAWPAHRKVCGRLAAALGRKAVTSTNSSSSSSSSSSNSQVNHPGSCTVEFKVFFGPSSAASDAASDSSHSSGSSTAGDANHTRDQESPALDGRVCAWCGKAAPNLLRCGRCKAAWYCGVDHQRAAWKAGHKQECG